MTQESCNKYNTNPNELNLIKNPQLTAKLPKNSIIPAIYTKKSGLGTPIVVKADTSIFLMASPVNNFSQKCGIKS